MRDTIVSTFNLTQTPSRAFRFLLEDHLRWILVYDFYVDNAGKHLGQPGFQSHLLVQKMSRQFNSQSLAHHGKGDIHRMGVEDLQSLSNFLGRDHVPSLRFNNSLSICPNSLKMIYFWQKKT